MDDETIEERLRAVERAVSEDEVPEHVAERAALSGRVDGVEADLADAEERIAELEAAVQALRGYVGDVRTVNRDVERRADSALAKVEELEADAARADPPETETARRDRPETGRRDRPPERRGEGRPRRETDHRAEQFEPDHPIPDPEPEAPSLRERIAAWL